MDFFYFFCYYFFSFFFLLSGNHEKGVFLVFINKGDIDQPSDIAFDMWYTDKYFSYLSIETYVVGTH